MVDMAKFLETLLPWEGDENDPLVALAPGHEDDLVAMTQSGGLFLIAKDAKADQKGLKWNFTSLKASRASKPLFNFYITGRILVNGVKGFFRVGKEVKEKTVESVVVMCDSEGKEVGKTLVDSFPANAKPGLENFPLCDPTYLHKLLEVMPGVAVGFTRGGAKSRVFLFDLRERREFRRNEELGDVAELFVDMHVRVEKNGTVVYFITEKGDVLAYSLS